MSDGQSIEKRQKAKVIISEKKKKIFLQHLALTGKVVASAQAAGYVDSHHLNRMRRNDKDFSARWDEALEVAGDMVEEEAFRRAIEGVLEPVYYRGEICGYKTNYSDQLLLTMLRKFRPEYRDKIDVHKTLKHDFGITILPMTAPKPLDWEKNSEFVHENQKQLSEFVSEKDVIEGEIVEEIVNTQVDKELKRGS